jgi:hypothetical protein
MEWIRRLWSKGRGGRDGEIMVGSIIYRTLSGSKRLTFCSLE